MKITQDRIDRFTEATDDPQWIHVDRERAADGPYGTTIAQGYLTMSLLVPLTSQVPLPLEEPPRMAVNYGLDRLRFPHHVPEGSRIRARVTLLDVSETGQGLDIRRRATVEIDGVEKPAAVADTVTRLFF
jgi:acyl dehydratase